MVDCSMLTCSSLLLFSKTGLICGARGSFVFPQILGSYIYMPRFAAYNVLENIETLRFPLLTRRTFPCLLVSVIDPYRRHLQTDLWHLQPFTIKLSSHILRVSTPNRQQDGSGLILHSHFLHIKSETIWD
ncbi:hypothetical protein GGU11DRAFT_116888 [Lentinula aff. detonsa]|nr:hypothetical protein GGU11DRAFT_116888 [Lentinula aff. detonsa]